MEKAGRCCCLRTWGVLLTRELSQTRCSAAMRHTNAQSGAIDIKAVSRLRAPLLPTWLHSRGHLSPTCSRFTLLSFNDRTQESLSHGLCLVRSNSNANNTTLGLITPIKCLPRATRSSSFPRIAGRASRCAIFHLLSECAAPPR